MTSGEREALLRKIAETPHGAVFAGAMREAYKRLDETDRDLAELREQVGWVRNELREGHR